MPIFFPEATPAQLKACELINRSVKPVKIATYSESLSFSQIQEEVLNRVKTRIRVMSEKEIMGHILAAESALTYRKRAYERPKFKMDALELLKNLSGHAHTLITAWGLKNIKTGKFYTGIAETKVFFRVIEEAELTNYVNDHEVVDWVGGYNPFHTKAATFIERIDGSLNNVLYNLPVENILPFLEMEKL